MRKTNESKQKVVNGFKLRTKPICMYVRFHFHLIKPLFSYKKWLNKSKVTDRELPDSRRNRSEDRVADDETSSAQTKPRMLISFIDC